jgi:hypothetical protein
MTGIYISWNQPKLKRFEAAYAQARKLTAIGGDVFTFEGHEFLLDYAKYLIQYLQGQRLPEAEVPEAPDPRNN